VLGHANLDAALALAAAGLAVFPCKGTAGDDGKRPLVAWRGESTSDADRVRRMWARFPRAVPAVDVGKSGLLVIDCDKPKAEGQADGEAWFETNVILENGADAIEFVTSRTPSGGVHYIFWQPQEGEPLGNGRGSLPPKEKCGVDVRGAGGYILAPGAVMHDGREYVLNGALTDIPQAPDWLVALLRKPAPAALPPAPSPLPASRPSISVPASAGRVGADAATARAGSARWSLRVCTIGLLRG
jgi:hypothetical protein